MSQAAATQHPLRLLTMQELGQQTSKVMTELVAGGTAALVTKRGRFIAMIVPLEPGSVENAVLARAEDILVPSMLSDFKVPSEPIEVVAKRYGLDPEAVLTSSTARSASGEAEDAEDAMGRQARRTTAGRASAAAKRSPRNATPKKAPVKKKQAAPRSEPKKRSPKLPMTRGSSSGAASGKKAAAKKGRSKTAPSKVSETRTSRAESRGRTDPTRGRRRDRSE